MYGDHPISGNRDFGFTDNGDGSYTFFAMGVDRLTNWSSDTMRVLGNVPFTQSDKLWKSFQTKIYDFLMTHEGASTINEPELHRPDWSVVKDVLDGKKPLNTLSKKCPPVFLDVE